MNLIDVDDGGVEYDKLVIKHANVELLMLNALVNPKSTKDIFTILLAKYDELLSDGMEIREGLVKKNIIEEADYIRFCKNIVVRRDNWRGEVQSWIDADEEGEERLLSQ